MFDFDFLVYVYFWVAFSGAVAVAAYGRERSATAWFFVSLIASPIVAAAYLFAMLSGPVETLPLWKRRVPAVSRGAGRDVGDRYSGFGTPRANEEHK
jgi:hypothetical protein